MRKSDFLISLVRNGNLKLVKISDVVADSYVRKSENCLKSAKILLKNKLYENSISMSYYAMYNCLLGLLFKVGIKSENHSGSIIVFKKLFKRKDLFEILSFAKQERIDKQYYVASKNSGLTKKSANEMIKEAENLVVQLRLIMNRLSIDEIDRLRKNFEKIMN